MYPELTNLLPKSAVDRLRQSYYLRLATVAGVLIVFVILVHGMLLIPSFLYARSQVAVAEDQISRLTAQLETSEGKVVEDRIAGLRADVEYLSRLSALSTGSSAVRGVLGVSRSGVSLSGFTYAAPDAATSSPKMTISGTATTRDSLRQFAQSLQSVPGVESAELPISAYAQETDIPFTVTLVGVPSI